MKQSGYRAMVAVPTRGSIAWQTATALEAARDYTPGLGPIVYQAGNLSVALTRNRIVKRFLASDQDVLVMVDDDIAPPVNFLDLLLPHVPPFAMVSLPHPMPHPAEPGQMILSVFEADGELLRPTGLAPGINEVDAVATGCVAISRDALEALSPAPFRIANDPDAPLQSDDFLFCEDLRAAGFTIGAWWDGRHIDHFRAVGLAPLMQATLERSPR